MQPGDRLICAFVREQSVGTEFEKWFLHVTVVPWFRLADSSELIAAGLKQALKTVKPFEAVGDSIATFRSRKNQPVRLLEQPTSFVLIEQKTRAYLRKKRAWLVDETTKKRQQFRPHVTSQAGDELAQGEKFMVASIYIVEQKGEHKEVVGEVKL